MKHGELVPSLHARELNPHIDFANSPFVVQQGLSHWKAPEGGVRMAGISSFGAGGANAHVIVSEYVEAKRPSIAGRLGGDRGDERDRGEGSGSQISSGPSRPAIEGLPA